MDWRKYQAGFSWKPVICCLLLNLAAAAAAFLGSILLTGSVFLTVFYTLIAWAVTVTLSFLYWIWWFFKNIRGVSAGARLGFLAAMLALLAAEWFVALSALSAFG